MQNDLLPLRSSARSAPALYTRTLHAMPCVERAPARGGRSAAPDRKTRTLQLHATGLDLERALIVDEREQEPRYDECRRYSSCLAC